MLSSTKHLIKFSQLYFFLYQVCSNTQFYPSLLIYYYHRDERVFGFMIFFSSFGYRITLIISYCTRWRTVWRERELFKQNSNQTKVIKCLSCKQETVRICQISRHSTRQWAQQIQDLTVWGKCSFMLRK